MVYKTLPHIETHLDIFYKYKHDNELFGLSVFKKDEINLPDLDTILQKMRNFFEKGIHFTDLDDVYYNHRQNWQTNIESYCKLVWLTYEYLNSDRKFKNYMGVHYNPINNTWDIHPGGSRQTVFNLFGYNEIELISFNTCGKFRKFTKLFKSKEELYENFSENIFFVLTAEHGSLIPHIHFDQNELKLSIIEWSKKIVHFWNTTNVVGNIPSWVTKNNSSKKNNTLELHVEDNTESILKGLILLPLYNNFSEFGISISVQENII